MPPATSNLRAAELFCGIGGFRLAADNLGVQTVWANDNDPLACKVYRGQFLGAVLQEGDIRECWSDAPNHDVLTAGFPCQPFSSAGKKHGIRDTRGTLFRVITDVLRARRPSHFILENVKRLLSMEKGEHFATILQALTDEGYFVEWRLLNAADFSLPQNRQRVLLVGTRMDQTEPAIRLASKLDIAELASSQIDRISSPTAWSEVTRHGDRFPTWGVAADGRFVGYELPRFSEGRGRVALSSVLEESVDAAFDFTESTLERITSSIKVDSFIQEVEILWNQNGGARMGYTVFGTRGLAPALTATASRHYERYKVGDRYRRLTPVEYERIQGFPEGHTAPAGTYARYALVGNAIPPPMAAWPLSRLLKADLLPIAGLDEPLVLFRFSECP